MKRSKHLLAFDMALLRSILLFIVLIIIIFPHYQYQINPDGISYISIAEKYIQSDYSNAINGYWGPLMSWLLVPILFIGIKPMIAIKMLLLIIALVTIIQSNALIKKLNINGLLRDALLFLIAIILINYALIVTTPDLLFVLLSLAYINAFLNSTNVDNKWSGLLCGLYGSGLYLTKSFGFPFFLTNFFILNLILYINSKNIYNKTRIINNFLSGIIVFGLISVCWISIISNKYGDFTIGTAGSYNYSMAISGHPMLSVGLLDPPNNTAVSVWEDPSLIKFEGLSTSKPSSFIKFQLITILRNIWKINSILTEFSSLTLASLYIAVVYFFWRGMKIITKEIFMLVVTVGILLSGYTLILVEARYLWLSNILIIIIGAKLLKIFFHKTSPKKPLQILITAIFIVSFLLSPLRSLYKNYDSGKSIYNISEKISQLNINGRIASENNWHNSLFLSYYNNWQYYGVRGKLSESELQTKLKDKMINYFLVWKPFYKEIEFLEKSEEIWDDTIDGLKIYKLK